MPLLCMVRFPVTSFSSQPPVRAYSVHHHAFVQSHHVEPLRAFDAIYSCLACAMAPSTTSHRLHTQPQTVSSFSLRSFDGLFNNAIAGPALRLFVASSSHSSYGLQKGPTRPTLLEENNQCASRFYATCGGLPAVASLTTRGLFRRLPCCAVRA
jgi:hypothetical protein